MRKIVAGLVVACVLVFAVSAFARRAPRNVGAPLPDWSGYTWEIQHKVRQGEFLVMLAGYYYQDPRKWNWIYEINRDRIRNPNRLKVGTVLVIKVPKNWEPTMPYNVWYERTKEDYGYSGKLNWAPGETPRAAIQPGKHTERPEGYQNQQVETRDSNTQGEP